VEGTIMGANSFGGKDAEVEESQSCDGVLGIAWGIAAVISDVGGSWILGLELAGTVHVPLVRITDITLALRRGEPRIRLGRQVYNQTSQKRVDNPNATVVLLHDGERQMGVCF
jgi:hypothetical protein